MQSIPHFKNQAVRDLVWSCFGPNLIDTFSRPDIHALELDLTAAREQRLLELDQNPEPLLTHLSDLKSRRLGLYVEALWKFFLLHDARIELIAHNIPILRDKRTLGELDVVYRDTASGACTHLELAVKFYLNIQTAKCSTQPGDFLGPNCKDRLDLKLARFISHQCPLSDTPEGKQTLADLGVHEVHKKIAVKGRLFYYDSLSPSADNCYPLSGSHLQGRWKHFSAFRHTAHEHKHWLVLEKRHWLSPVHYSADDPNGDHTIHSPNQLISFLGDAFEIDQRPRIVCPMTQTGTTLRETDRYFVTPDNWPVMP